MTNQLRTIGEYAARRDIEIVTIYEDASKSGLSLRGRAAFKRLLEDVQTNAAGFTDLLVYDISRWGRFQDIDESAHYEFLCRQSGVNVIYCADEFENDGSITAAYIKTQKRSFASDFSRQLSVKIFATQSLLASRGHNPGATCPYGLKRVAVDANGRRRKALKRGHLKDVDSYHVVLAPGAPDEVRVIQRIFDMLVNGGCSLRGIGRHLNADGIPSPDGVKWTSQTILHILRNDKYIGTQFYNRSSSKLQAPRVSNPKEIWIEKRCAFPAIVDARLFKRAQKLLLAPYQKRKDQELLASLRTYIEMNGKVSYSAARAFKGLANKGTYDARFGSFRKACALAGFSNLANFRTYDEGLRKRAVRLGILAELGQLLEKRGAILTFTTTAHLFKLDNQLMGYFDLRNSSSDSIVEPYWRLRFPARDVVEVYIIGRLMKGDVPMDYYAIPRVEVLAPTDTMHLKDVRLDRYRHATLDKLAAALAASLRAVFRRAYVGGGDRFND